SLEVGSNAPLEVITIVGRGLGPKAGVAASGTTGFPTVLGGTRVLVSGLWAPLLYAGESQINAVVPAGVGTRQGEITVFTATGSSAPWYTWFEAVSPGLFTADGSGSGQASILNQDGTTNSPRNPASRGSVVVLYGTGGGLTAPAFADG